MAKNTSYRGYGAARTPNKGGVKCYADGGMVKDTPAQPTAPSNASPSLAQRLRKLVGMETKSEAGGDFSIRRAMLDKAERDALKK